ncbi:type II toxin-antitoxin system RelE/ParE family toxin [Flavivirga sp. 57AJ16]|uniref:type II toxin-antitoxin system RelE/ParE family toxin n=1 Tax=Flavivirga sp. 57AJ16 TaxID=3025307 RepID=UPI0023671381|nr:type II toxin-antitoxin system RelE/ParE family toxin [Flavivirga sp. 57AJ16]MDD7885907.1 type II toxin-antitoxin system RelE/ParE family toxin [Flavivirga sp. 57AJ16]
MAELKVFWTQTAKKQRDYIFEYWNKRNKSANYSKKLNISIRDRINLLKDHPEIGKEVDFKNTKAISLGHYSILYKIMRPKIIITAFWDNRQDPEKFIKSLKKN